MATATAKRGLGKGLSALMSDAEATPTISHNNKEHANGAGGIATLPVEALAAGKFQPRRHFDDETLRELADSIEKNGIMQPIVVRPVTGSNKYEIIAGERRWRAAKLAKLNEVPIIIRKVNDAVALELALVENIQRADLNPLEEAEGYQRLMKEFSYTQERLASTVGKSRSHVANLLRLLSLPAKIKQRIDSGQLTMGHARAILSAKDAEGLAEAIVATGLSVRQAEELAKTGDYLALQGGTVGPKAKKEGGSIKLNANKSDEVRQIEEMLAENLGLRVSINTRGAQAGEVIVSYDSLSQLDEILRRLGGSI